MNCCNDYGQCTQGADCPARAVRAISDSCKPLKRDAGYWVAIAITSVCTCGVLDGLAGFFYVRGL